MIYRFEITSDCILRQCTTPKVLANMREAMSGPEELDGFDVLRDEDKERIQRAWDEGEISENEKPEDNESEGEKPKSLTTGKNNK
jgi:hypothetical protein